MKLSSLLLATVATTALFTTGATAKGKMVGKTAHKVECAPSAPVMMAHKDMNMGGFFLGASFGGVASKASGDFKSAHTALVDATGPVAAGATALANVTPAAAGTGHHGNLNLGSAVFSPEFGLFGGYTHQMGNMLVGAEVNFATGKNNMDLIKDSSMSGSDAADLLPATSLKKKFSFGFHARLGVLLNAKTNLYIKLGLQRVAYEMTSTPNHYFVQSGGTAPVAPNAYASKVVNKINKMVFAPALGVETFVNDNMFVRMEASYQAGAEVGYKDNRSVYSNGTATHTGQVTSAAAHFAYTTTATNLTGAGVTGSVAAANGDTLLNRGGTLNQIYAGQGQYATHMKKVSNYGLKVAVGYKF